MNRAVICLGSNIDPEKNISSALCALNNDPYVLILKKSSWIRTSPVGFTEQPDFINTAVLVNTELDEDPLRRYLKTIEASLGRIRTANRNGPRTIDLDIIVWNGTIIDDDFYTRDYLRTIMDEISE